jgi:acetylornithine deacetylase/succinyl-diaminopimelate desuccinylase-like protein
MSQFQEWYQQHSSQILNDFFTFLSFPSISTDHHYKKATRDTALWLEAYLKKLGLEAELWETTGHPVVFASHLAAGADRPTLLLYHHYDVQPIDPIELWESDPFKPVVRNNQVFARGAVDNKGQCFYSIQAVGAFLQLAKVCRVNIKIFIEGEEETGSAGTFALLPQKAEALKADYLLIVDTGIPESGVPAITLGVRGITTMHVEVSNSLADLHSGEHGGIALNPLRALSTMLAKMWDENGQVMIPDFYRDVRLPSEKETALYDLEFDREKYRETFGVNAFAPDFGFDPKMSNCFRPTLEINGIQGGYSGPGFKTVIPAKAAANISARLVPDQDPDKVCRAIEQFLHAQLPVGLKFKFEPHHGGKSYRCAYPSLIADVCAKSYQEVFKKPCKLTLCGASVPIVAELARESDAEALLIGVGLPDDDIHAPNEHFGLDRFEQGFLVITEILRHLSER